MASMGGGEGPGWGAEEWGVTHKRLVSTSWVPVAFHPFLEPSNWEGKHHHSGETEAQKGSKGSQFPAKGQDRSSRYAVRALRTLQEPWGRQERASRSRGGPTPLRLPPTRPPAPRWPVQGSIT